MEKRITTKNLNKNKKSTKPLSLPLIAGILIVTNAALVGIAAKWFPGIFPTLPGSTDNSAVPFTTITTIGLICGVVVLLGAFMLRSKPASKKVWSIVIIAFSIPSVVIGGGFVVGFILGIIGGALAFSRKSEL